MSGQAIESDHSQPTVDCVEVFSFARAAVYEGPGALPPEGRKQVDEYLTKVYTKYAGSEEGLAEIKLDGQEAGSAAGGPQD